jgi:NAD dependent epimerase/dehydratase family enzyme
VAKAWENEFQQGLLPTQRPVILRTSFVIGRNRDAGGGALARLKFLARLGLAGTVGSGKQGLSWIHETDLIRITQRALIDQAMSGVYIASSPHPVSQREFMAELRRAMRVPIGLPATEWMVRLGAHWLLRTDPELILYGRYVIPQRLMDDGFSFAFPRLREALADLTIRGSNR